MLFSLAISADIRRIALIVILMRAGLSLNLDDLRRVGRPSVLMCFVPATFEVLGMVLLAPRLLGLSLVDAAVLGAVIGAVSPAVIVPKMLRLMETGWGTDKRIPQLPLAMGLSCGEIVLTVAVLSILITAPLGALLIDITYPRLLTLSDAAPGGQETA